MTKPETPIFDVTSRLSRAWLFPDGTEYVSGNDATLSNSPTTVSTGKWGDAVDFVAASSQYAHAGDSTAFDGLSAFTLYFGLLPDTLVTNAAIVRKRRAGQLSMTCNMIDTLGNVRMGVTGANGQDLTVDTSFAPLTAGTAINCAMRWGGGSDLKFYANGATGNDTNNAATPDTVANSAEFLSFMGRYNGGVPDQFCDGKLAYVYLSPQADSVSEIQAVNDDPFVFLRETNRVPLGQALRGIIGRPLRGKL